MTSQSKKILRTGVMLVSVPVLLLTCLWAQSRPNVATSAAVNNSGIDAAGATGTGATVPKPDPTIRDDAFVIGADDVLAVNVWKEPEISRSIPVRSDGKISLPLVGEVQAAGRTPLKLEQDIATRLRNYISEPEVTVMVQQINSQKFNVLGQVMRPGTFVIANAPTVLDAIALAGGFRDFAKQRSIYVLRQNADGTQTRLPFNYKDVVSGKNLQQNIKLQARDTVVVP